MIQYQNKVDVEIICIAIVVDMPVSFNVQLGIVDVSADVTLVKTFFV